MAKKKTVVKARSKDPAPLPKRERLIGGPLEKSPGKAPTEAAAAKAIADLADRTHDARAPRGRAPVVPVPGRTGEYVQDFGQLDGIIAREARKRSARDDREGVY